MKIKVTIEITKSDFETLKTGLAEDFEETCTLVADLQTEIQAGRFEIVK